MKDVDGLPAACPAPPGGAAQLLAAIAGAARRRDAKKTADAHLASLARDPLALAGFLHGQAGSSSDALADAARAGIAAALTRGAGEKPGRTPALEPAKPSVPARGRNRGAIAGAAAAPDSASPFEPSAADIADALDHAVVVERESAAKDGRAALVVAGLGALAAAAVIWLALA